MQTKPNNNFVRFNIVPFAESKFDNSMFYSINYKSLHLVSFSTEVYFSDNKDEIQTAINWLEKDLAEANRNRLERPWIILLTHHPIYCSIISSDCTTKASMIRDGVTDSNNQTWGGLEKILLKHRVDIYMRFVIAWSVLSHYFNFFFFYSAVVMFIIMKELILYRTISELLLHIITHPAFSKL